MPEIYVVDLETTGLRGGPNDLVVDIGICKYNTNYNTIEEVYSSHLGYDTSEWYARQNAWIFTHPGAELRVEDVDVNNGCPPAEQVIKEAKSILSGQWLTSYNTGFDLDRFLFREPWWVNCKRAPDIMSVADAYLHKMYYYQSSGRPSLQKSYDWVFKESDPAEIGGLEKHLGLPDALMATHLLRRMYRDGMYVLPEIGSGRMFY